MRSRKSHTISSHEVATWALDWLLKAKLLKDHGWLCTAAVVWAIVLRAAARKTSIRGACCDLSEAPTDNSVFLALSDGLPKTRKALERRLNLALTDHLPTRLRRRAWQIAIDWHMVPYYGSPKESPNEVCTGKPEHGTTTFHTYASACIVVYGHRYTLALTWVRRHESMVTVLERLLARVRELGLTIRYVLLDRAFFNVSVVTFLQQEKLPFLMPTVIRGRKPRKGRRLTGLRWIQPQSAGLYPHTMQNRRQNVTIQVCVAYRTHKNRKDGKRVQQKLTFAAWRVRGTPTEIRERYRKRFGIESSFRQLRQAKIYTCTQDPHLRLVFVVVGLLLRNLWVWIHNTLLAEGRGDAITIHLEKLRFKRMLDWIAQWIVGQLHDGSMPCVE
jgi:hypothetical protein